MTYYALEPEVAGHLGDRAVVDRSVHPPVVQRLHYEFDGWLGDDLIESFPSFIATRGLRERLAESGLSGCQFDDVEVSKSDIFQEIHPDRELPEFAWLKVVGRAGMDDFGLSPDHRLVVSQRGLDVLKSFKLDHCDTEQYEVPAR
jgi:hypothetical protein